MNAENFKAESLKLNPPPVGSTIVVFDISSDRRSLLQVNISDFDIKELLELEFTHWIKKPDLALSKEEKLKIIAQTFQQAKKEAAEICEPVGIVQNAMEKILTSLDLI